MLSYKDRRTLAIAFLVIGATMICSWTRGIYGSFPTQQLLGTPLLSIQNLVAYGMVYLAIAISKREI